MQGTSTHNGTFDKLSWVGETNSLEYHLKKIIETFDDRWLSRRMYNNFEWKRFTDNILNVIHG
jgi:hypothetical protein